MTNTLKLLPIYIWNDPSRKYVGKNTKALKYMHMDSGNTTDMYEPIVS